MLTTTKVLILTWIVIGFLVGGGIGFYLGRATALKSANLQSPNITQPDLQQQGQPSGGPNINRPVLPSGAPPLRPPEGSPPPLP